MDQLHATHHDGSTAMMMYSLVLPIHPISSFLFNQLASDTFKLSSILRLFCCGILDNRERRCEGVRVRVKQVHSCHTTHACTLYHSIV